MCDNTLFPTAIIALVGSLACCTVSVWGRETVCVCVCVHVCTFMCLCGSVLIGMLLSHGLYSLRLWITAFSRLVWWIGLYQLTAHNYTTQLGETGLGLWVASSEPWVSCFSKALIIVPSVTTFASTPNSQNVLSKTFFLLLQHIGLMNMWMFSACIIYF